MSPGDFFHPMHGEGYQFWSGIGSDIGELSILIAIAVFVYGWWRVHNCHVRGCLRLMWHPHPVHGHPVCRHHHPDGGQIVADRAG